MKIVGVLTREDKVNAKLSVLNLWYYMRNLQRELLVLTLDIGRKTRMYAVDVVLAHRCMHLILAEHLYLRNTRPHRHLLSWSSTHITELSCYRGTYNEVLNTTGGAHQLLVLRLMVGTYNLASQPCSNTIMTETLHL